MFIVPQLTTCKYNLVKPIRIWTEQKSVRPLLNAILCFDGDEEYVVGIYHPRQCSEVISNLADAIAEKQSLFIMPRRETK